MFIIQNTKSTTGNNILQYKERTIKLQQGNFHFTTTVKFHFK